MTENVCACAIPQKNPDLEEKRRKCEVYSRTVGYLRPVNQWNVGKQQEFKDRKAFKLKGDI